MHIVMIINYIYIQYIIICIIPELTDKLKILQTERNSAF